MIQNIVPKIIFSIFFSLISIFFYYFVFTFHQESFGGSYFMYLCLVIISYSIYKYYLIQFGENEYRFSFLGLLFLGFLHLFILSICFFQINNLTPGYGLILFLSICFYLILPISVFLLSHSLGEKVLSYIKGFSEEENFFKISSSLGVGFFLFTTVITLLGFLGTLNLISFLGSCLFILLFCYKTLLKNIKELFSFSIIVPAHNTASKNWKEVYQPYLLISEFLFLTISGLISVNFINIVRPFPIGWDDLGVYMNIPNMIGNSGIIEGFGQMISWQVYTSLGFLFGSTVQAFFLNSFSGVLVAFFIIFGINSILGWEKKHHLIGNLFHKKEEKILPIGLLLGTIYLALPMTIFQLAKDMKLDQGLFFVTIICLYILFYILKKGEKSNYTLILLGILGIVCGFAFSIKVTSLLLILGIIGVISFYKIGILGFLGYVAIFIGVFTKLKLWGLMNVVYPKDNADFINIVTSLSLFLGILLFIVSKTNKETFVSYIKWLGSFILGIIIALSPWLIWNTIKVIEKGQNLHIISLINGPSTSFIPDLLIIRSQEYLDKKAIEVSMTSSGKSINEDYGRYFGYESGINNYLKLRWNLSMQVNQRGEFTDISYIFFALLPALLLFLPLKKKLYEYIIYGILIFEILFFMIAPTSVLLTNFFSLFSLPLGYSIILLFYGLCLIFLIYAVDYESENRVSKVFLYSSVFGIFYVFLWAISSFGIVWYGIAMYFFLLLSIAFCLQKLSTIEYNEDKTNIPYKILGSYLVFGIIAIYFTFSSYPHMFINLQSAGYQDFKIGAVTEKESIFISHPEYFDFLYEMNIKESKKKDFFSSNKSHILENLKKNEGNKDIIETIEGISDIRSLERILTELMNTDNIQIKNMARNERNQIYKNIIHPSKDYKNDTIIYRVGTFMKYFIHENQKRILEDSLLTVFNDYIYDTNPKVVKERLKKFGISHILLDLNAATIDVDPRKSLTQRYENMLRFIASDEVTYITGDSVCLILGLDIYKKSQKTEKDMQNYLSLAGINYDSLGSDGKIITRNTKLGSCFLTIKDMINNNQVSNTSPEFLIRLYNYIKSPENEVKTDEDWLNMVGKNISPGFKILVKINE